MTNLIARAHALRLAGAAAIALAAASLYTSPAKADDCLLDTNNDGFATSSSPADSDGGANSTGDNTRVACGFTSTATADGATALGHHADASMDQATAIGQHAQATGLSSVAIGGGVPLSGGEFSSAVAGGNYSVAVGFESEARGLTSTAVGGFAIADAGYSLALGFGRAMDNYAIALHGVANGYGSIAMGEGANTSAASEGGIAIGSRSHVAGRGTIALGEWTNAAADFAIALGSDADGDLLGAQATGIASVALGVDAIASAANAVALGTATATAEGAMALGVDSSAGGERSAAIGPQSRTFERNTTAIGFNSSAIGRGSVAIGFGARTAQFRGTAIGFNADAAGFRGTAVGEQASAAATDATAIGHLAVAGHEASTAIGANATTTAANQVMLGGAGSSVVVADIDASTAAQVGPVDVVTIDASGTLGRQQVASAASVQNVRAYMGHIAAVTDAQFNALAGEVGALTNRVSALEQQMVFLDERIASSTATSVALGGAVFLPEKAFNLSASVGTYDGAHAGAFQLGVLVSENVAFNAGIATGFNKNGKTAGRAGITFGF